MNKKVLLSSLLILFSLSKASEKSQKDQSASKFALEDAIERLDVKAVKDILAKEEISENRKAWLAKYCQNITKLYLKKTTSIFNSHIDRYSFYGGLFGWFIAMVPGAAAYGIYTKRKQAKISNLITDSNTVKVDAASDDLFAKQAADLLDSKTANANASESAATKTNASSSDATATKIKKNIDQVSNMSDPTSKSEVFTRNEIGAMILYIPIFAAIGYFSTKLIMDGIKLKHAFGNLKKARQIEYLINGID